MNSSIKKIAIGLLILSIVLVTAVVLLSLWNIIDAYVLWRSIFTIIVVALASLLVIYVKKETSEKK